MWVFLKSGHVKQKKVDSYAKRKKFGSKYV